MFPDHSITQYFVSLLSSLDLDLELAGGHARDLGGDHGVDPEVGQGAPH